MQRKNDEEKIHYYRLDRGSALLHLLGMKELEPECDLEKEELKKEISRLRTYIEREWER